MDQKTQFKIGSLLFRGFGYGAVALSLYFIVANTIFWIRAESTIGTVVGWQRMEGIREDDHRRRNLDPAKATVVEFKTKTGDTVVFATDVGSGLELHDVGEEVTVLYLEDNPENAKLRGFFYLYVGPLLLGVMGCVFAFFGVLLQFFYEPSPAKRRSYS